MEKYGIPWREIGEGMREMLVTALFQTRRFMLLERDLLPEILKEQDLAGTGRIAEGTAPATGGIIGADLIVTGAVTEFIADAFGAKGAAEVGGTAIDASVAKGYVGLVIKIIDAKTSEVVLATYVMGKASNYGFEAEPGPESKLPLSLAVFARTPAEKAIRSAIRKAAEEVAGSVPREYFRH
jgi:curli biogenesis system outer membrane secretion channel CsgG